MGNKMVEGRDLDGACCGPESNKNEPHRSLDLEVKAADCAISHPAFSRVT